MQDPYLYPGTGALRNRLQIQDAEKLKDLERDLASLRMWELQDRPVAGCFDLEHLQRIHAYLFQDIYEWAGEKRKVDIAKEDLFCRHFAIEDEARRIFLELKTEKYLMELDTEAFVRRLAYYFAEINALHPFREGNGRTQREFIRSLAYRNNYFLSYAGISAEQMIEASRASLRKNYQPLQGLILSHLRPLL